jgi:hypothetical protein
MVDRIAVTFAARRWPDLPTVTDTDTVSTGTPVPMPGGLTGTFEMGSMMAVKSAQGPDEWRAAFQVIVDVAGAVAAEVAVKLVAEWILSKVRPTGTRQTPLIDQSVHNDVRVFIGHIEVNVGSRDEVEAAVRDAIAAATPQLDLPPELRRHEAVAAGMTDEDWLQAQIKAAREWREDFERQKREAERE